MWAKSDPYLTRLSVPVLRITGTSESQAPACSWQTKTIHAAHRVVGPFTQLVTSQVGSVAKDERPEMRGLSAKCNHENLGPCAS